MVMQMTGSTVRLSFTLSASLQSKALNWLFTGFRMGPVASSLPGNHNNLRPY